jgi:hypothetical protein
MTPTLGRPTIRAACSITLILIVLVGIRWWLADGHQNPGAQSPPVTNNAPSLAFDPAIADQLVGKLPRGKPIDVVAVGSSADWGVAGHYAEYLKTKGFEVTLTKVGMVSPAPDQKIKIGDASDRRVSVIIAPSAF